MRRIAVAALFVALAIGCRSGSLRRPHGPECQPAGTTSLTVRQGVGEDLRLQASQMGRLHVSVQLRPVGGTTTATATLTLFADSSRAAGATPLRGAELQDGEWARWDSLPAGPGVFRARGIGFSPFEHPVIVRAGFTDTLRVSLRSWPICEQAAGWRLPNDTLKPTGAGVETVRLIACRRSGALAGSCPPPPCSPAA